jgi:hypothetical protein
MFLAGTFNLPQNAVDMIPNFIETSNFILITNLVRGWISGPKFNSMN